MGCLGRGCKRVGDGWLAAGLVLGLGFGLWEVEDIGRFILTQILDSTGLCKY